MRVHNRESERPSNVDLLSKILRRASHTPDPASSSPSLDDSPSRKSITHLGDLHSGSNAARGRKGSHHQQHISNNNQHRLSVSGGNSRFSTFFIDPLYHAIMMGKGKDDSARASLSAAAASHAVAGAPPRARALSDEEATRRQALLTLSFDDLHAAFDPYNGAAPDDAMDNNELETLLEQKEGSRHTLEAKAPATVRFAIHEASSDGDGESTITSSHEPSQCDAPEQDGDDDGDDGDDDADHDDGEELHFDAPNMAVSVKKLMFRISSMSATPSSDADVSTRSNQDDDDDDDDDDGDSNDDTVATDRDDEAAVVIDDVSLEALEPLMIETTTPPTYVPSCFPQAEMPQDLSASVRRLVIDLKDDSDRRHEAPAPLGFAARRRGNSCPVPIRVLTGGAGGLSPSTATTPATAAAAAYFDTSDAVRKRKKTSFGRLAPRLLETLTFRRKKKTFHYTDEELESIEGARWKIVELAFRFGGKHRFYLVQAVNMFFPLLKYGRRGGPHPTRLHCNHCGTLQWQHKRGSLSDSVDLAHVLQVLDGRQTAVFRKYPMNAALDACSFSIIFTDRTLDLETQSVSHRDWLMSALRTLISYAKTQRAAEERAIAERSILPLDDPPLIGALSGDAFAGITSPPASGNSTMLLL